MADGGFRTGDDVTHLGTVVGEAGRGRIVALATSGVFDDPALVWAFWNRDAADIDSGIQGHLYTRPEDVFVVRMPRADDDAIASIAAALDVNAQIWATATGIRLASARSRLLMACAVGRSGTGPLAPHLTWHVGALSDAAALHFRSGNGALLAFVLDRATLERLNLDPPDAVLSEQAATTSRFMDKNEAMRALQAIGVPAAQSWGFTPETWRRTGRRLLPADGRYVFKPSGGAAGIGVFFDPGSGSTARAIEDHVGALQGTGQLPGRFQVQRFLRGTPHGVSAFLSGSGAVDILEAHRQVIDSDGRWAGARWTPRIHAAQLDAASNIYARLAGTRALTGLVGVDMIAGTAIEVNPRLTASAPIAHLLRRAGAIREHRGHDFRMRQLDVSTSVAVPRDAVADGRLCALIDRLDTEFGVLALPQGLNPFGDSRFVFVNDDSRGTAQAFFRRGLARWSSGEAPADVQRTWLQ